MHQKKERCQVIIDVIKNSTCFQAFTISAEVPDIFMQQFWVNVDYPKLIWEDFAFQIDHRKEKKSRRKTMPFPRFTKVIINHFLSQHKYLSKLKFQHYHTIKDDGIIKQSESYQMFIIYSTSQIPPKKSRGKGSQGKKTGDVSQESVDVSY
nr:hypothetical protein [Tanacetum cinerariifolium]